MFIASTRFNTDTLMENNRYKETHNIAGCIYGASIKINHKYPLNAWMFVFEMNNSENTIEGIGLIRNMLSLDKRYRIYEAGDYNRYIYKGKHWISREQIMEMAPNIIEIFEKILFKGKSNLKRMSGICVVTDKLFARWEYESLPIMNQIKEMFQRLYTIHF